MAALCLHIFTHWCEHRCIHLYCETAIHKVFKAHAQVLWRCDQVKLSLKQVSFLFHILFWQVINMSWYSPLKSISTVFSFKMKIQRKYCDGFRVFSSKVLYSFPAGVCIFFFGDYYISSWQFSFCYGPDQAFWSRRLPLSPCVWCSLELLFTWSPKNMTHEAVEHKLSFIHPLSACFEYEFSHWRRRSFLCQ